MKNLRPFITAHSITIYVVMTFMISWGLIVLLAGLDKFPLDPVTSEEILPLLYTSMLFGPSIAGLLLTGYLDGRQGLRNFASRLLHWKVGLKWYLLALFVTPLLAIIKLKVLTFSSDDYQILLLTSGTDTSAIVMGLTAGLMVGIFEETGWTGFVTSRFLSRFNIIKSGFILGVIWGLWHFILFWDKDSFSDPYSFLLLVMKLLLWIPPFRILLISLYKKTESLFVVILAHMSLVFTTTVIVPVTLEGHHLFVWVLSWGVILWLLVSVIWIMGKKEFLFRANHTS